VATFGLPLGDIQHMAEQAADGRTEDVQYSERLHRADIPPGRAQNQRSLMTIVSPGRTW
jgi:hypothetical protein